MGAKPAKSPLDQFFIAKGWKNRVEVVKKLKVTRTAMALMARGDFGSLGMRQALRKALPCTKRELNDAIRASGADYLERIGEDD